MKVAARCLDLSLCHPAAQRKDLLVAPDVLQTSAKPIRLDTPPRSDASLFADSSKNKLHFAVHDEDRPLAAMQVPGASRALIFFDVKRGLLSRVAHLA